MTEQHDSAGQILPGVYMCTLFRLPWQLVSTAEGWSGSLTVHVQADQAASKYSRKGWPGSLRVHVKAEYAAGEYM